MKRRTVAAATAAAAVGGAAVWYRRRARAGHAAVHHAVTVLTEPEETRAAWRDGRATGLLAAVEPTADETEPARPVPGDGGLVLRVLLTPAPQRRGTEIRVSAGGPGARTHSGRLREDLRRLKAVLECGEALTVEGQPSARGPLGEHLQDRIYAALRRGGTG